MTGQRGGRAVDAIDSIGLHVPLGEFDNSWLRTLLLEAPHQELDAFGDALMPPVSVGVS